MRITPPIHENRDLMSVALIKRLVKDGGETCVRVMKDMSYGIGLWITHNALFFEPYTRHDVQYWMFAAYEACVAGNTKAVHAFLDIARTESHLDDHVVPKSVQFLETVWNAHNDEKVGPTRQTVGIRLGFNDCIYNCLLHNDPISIKAVIKTYEINLLALDYYTRDSIRERAEMQGYESCKKVLRDYEFF
jgi:hypothetical protein